MCYFYYCKLLYDVQVKYLNNELVFVNFLYQEVDWWFVYFGVLKILVLNVKYVEYVIGYRLKFDLN